MNYTPCRLPTSSIAGTINKIICILLSFASKFLIPGFKLRHTLLIDDHAYNHHAPVAVLCDEDRLSACYHI